ncbi:MAG: NUDIX hydrolase [Pirellulales bacterium]|nr:NUDIX hydrolase [Pirellulales bacterium]
MQVPPPELLLQAQRFRVERHAGISPTGKLHVRETVRHPGAVTIVPLFDDGRICLIRNFRLSVGTTLVELPAGTLEPGEPPLETAHRELREETGYRANSIEAVGEFWMSPGILDERMYLYVARGLTAGKTHLDATEEIETLVTDWNEALAMIDRGEIQDAKSIAGLLQVDRLLRAGR